MKTRLAYSLAFASLLILAPAPAAAVPAFARQTGASCSSCHFQHFPGLTAYGRLFKMSGYTMAGGQGLIEDRHLSLSSVLNASLVTKIRYVKTNGTSGAGSDVGEFQFPDEAAVWMGGRVSSNVGFVLEAQISDPGSPIFASFKMPISFPTRFGRLAAIPFSTDGLGASFGFELLNTGAVANTRMLEEKAALSAVQYVAGGSDEGKAEGVAFVLTGKNGFVNVTPWTPSHGSVAVDHPAWYIRAGITQTFRGWDLALGMQRWTGTAQATNQRVNAWGMDLQAQGQAAGRPLGFYAGYARAPGSTAPSVVFLNPETRDPAGGTGAVMGGLSIMAPAPNLFNTERATQQAASVMGELGVVPRRLTLAAGGRLADNGKETASRDIAGTLGLTFLMAQNIQIQLNQVFLGGNAWNGTTGHSRTVVMIFAGF